MEEGFTIAQLHVLKRQIATLKLLNTKLKAVANGVQLLPRVVTTARSRGKGGGSRQSKSQRIAVIEEDDAAEGIDDGEAAAAPGTSSDDEPELDSDDSSEDGEEPELSTSSEFEGDDDKAGTGHRRPTTTTATTPARRTARTAQRQRLVLKEPSFNDEESEEDDDDGEENGAVTSLDGGMMKNTTKSKSSPSPAKKRKKFIMVGGGCGAGEVPSNVDIPLSQLRPVKLTWPTDDDAICSVCGDGDAVDNNVILFCEGKGCEVAVHQRCYGVDKVPKGKWLCEPCSTKKLGKKHIRCCSLCPVEGGALRRVTTLGRVVPAPSGGKEKKGKKAAEKAAEKAAAAAPPPMWVHSACALWTPGVTLTDADRMKDVDLSGLTLERVGLKCMLCGQAGGAAIQCSYGSCCRAFHVLCGRLAQYEITFSITGDPLAFCSIHSRPRYEPVRQAICDGQDPETAMEEAARAQEEGLDDGAAGADDGGGVEPMELVEYELQRQKNVARIAQARELLLRGGK